MKITSKFSKRIIAGLSLALLAGTALASPASGSVPNANAENGNYVEIGGKLYGPEHGLEVIYESYEVGEGKDIEIFYGEQPTGSIIPMAQWGASYATSTEYLQLHYRGKALAAANIYDGKRIIQVCISYTRGGVVVAAEKCSSASSPSNYWIPGSEVIVTAWDSLNPNAPVTTFNIRTTRVGVGV